MSQSGCYVNRRRIYRPGAQGFKEEFRAREKLVVLSPAAAVTAHTGPEYRASVLKAGFQYHVEKPCGIRELVRIVAALALNEEARWAT